MAHTCGERFEADGAGALAAEWFGMLFHGLDITHLDALSHIAREGSFYNGMPVDRQGPARGSLELAVTNATTGTVGRGVLNIPALDRTWLDPSDAVRPRQLDNACARQGVAIEPGDIVLLRTGFAQRRRDLGLHPSIASDGYPGWHPAWLPWLHERQVPAIAADTANDARPSGYHKVPTPLHYVGIVAKGLWLIDNCDLAELAQMSTRRRRWSFLFIASGLRLRIGSEFPLNPMAMF
jgi:kynurenine formamidase